MNYKKGHTSQHERSRLLVGLLLRVGGWPAGRVAHLRADEKVTTEGSTPSEDICSSRDSTAGNCPSRHKQSIKQFIGTSAGQAESKRRKDEWFRGCADGWMGGPETKAVRDSALDLVRDAYHTSWTYKLASWTRGMSKLTIMMVVFKSIKSGWFSPR